MHPEHVFRSRRSLRSVKPQSDQVAVSLLFCFFPSPYTYRIVPIHLASSLAHSMGLRYILITCHVNTIFIDTFDTLMAPKQLDIMHTGCT